MERLPWDTQSPGQLGSRPGPPLRAGIRIQAVIRTPVELLAAGQAEQPFLGEVERGIVLWEKGVGEPGVQAVSRRSRPGSLSPEPQRSLLPPSSS